MWLFLAFLAVPLIEIALFIQIGGLIGLGPTLGIVVLTAVLGTWLVRNQGRQALGQIQRSFQEIDDPTEPLANGAMIVFAGALLLTPGFFTDAVGFLLLFPPTRAVIYRQLRKRVVVQSVGGFQPETARRPRGAQGDILDGDYTEVTPQKDRPQTDGPQAPSGWTRH
ncbi:MAG: FxsA family protein [Pseudomonadota bacterium]